MGEGSNVAVYLLEYLGWDPDRLEAAFKRTRAIYRALGVRDRLLMTDRAAAVYVFSQWAKAVSEQYGVDPAKLEVLPPGFPTPEPVARDHRDTFTSCLLGRSSSGRVVSTSLKPLSRSVAGTLRPVLSWPAPIHGTAIPTEWSTAGSGRSAGSPCWTSSKPSRGGA